MRYVLAAAALLLSAEVQAKVITKPVEYKHGDTKLIGYLAYDDISKEKRPGVLVVHEWWGLNQHTKQRCEQLAAMGYVAFAVDMYGDGVVTNDKDKAAEWSGQFKGNVKLQRERAQAGLDVLAAQELAEPTRLAAIGFCFGGTTVLQMALGGANVAAVVSFHGGIAAVPESDVKAVKARILILHGADDPFIPAADIAGFQETLRKANADWQMVYYGKAVHSFTNPWAKGEIPGAKYNADADRRAWVHMQTHFKESFGEVRLKHERSPDE